MAQGGNLQGSMGRYNKDGSTNRNANTGKFGQDLDNVPSQAKGESRDAYLQRLKAWQQMRARRGSKPGTQSKPAPKKKEPAGGFVDRILRGLNGDAGGK